MLSKNFVQIYTHTLTQKLIKIEYKLTKNKSKSDDTTLETCFRNPLILLSTNYFENELKANFLYI